LRMQWREAEEGVGERERGREREREREMERERERGSVQGCAARVEVGRQFLGELHRVSGVGCQI